MIEYDLYDVDTNSAEIVSDLGNKEKTGHILDRAAMQFSDEVIQLIENDGGSGMSCLLEVCIRHDVTEETVKSLITPKLMFMLEADSESRHLFKKVEDDTLQSQRLY